MLSPSQYAERIGKPYQTIMAWLRKDLIEGAEKTEVGKMSVYLIPEDAKYTEPPMGRPSKKQSTDGEVSTATDAADDAMPAVVTGKKPAKKARKKGTDQ